MKFFKYCYFNQQMFIHDLRVFQEGELLLGRALLLGEVRYTLFLFEHDRDIIAFWAALMLNKFELISCVAKNYIDLENTYLVLSYIKNI